MKNQYAGDINDFRKFGLIRTIADLRRAPIVVNWMLTENDGKSDGKFIEYLTKADRFEQCDPELFNALHDVVRRNDRTVEALEKAELIPNARYYGALVPDESGERRRWFDSFLGSMNGSELVFLDPDNGIEVKSKRKGCKGSSKYVFWDELRAIWSRGCSLLIYQHFPRVKREMFIRETAAKLQRQLQTSKVVCYSTSSVLFILALQDGEQNPLIHKILTLCNQQWNGQIITHATPSQP